MIKANLLEKTPFKNWENWIEPHHSIIDPLQRHHYRFIRALLLTFQFILMAILGIYLLTGIDDKTLIYAAILLLVFNTINYFGLHSSYYRYAPYSSILVLHVAFWGIVANTSSDISLGILFSASFVIAFTTVILGTFSSFISAIINLVGILIYTQHYDYPLETRVLMILSLSNITAALVIRDYYRGILEKSRRKLLEEAVVQAEQARQVTEQANQELKHATALAKENARLRSEFMSTMSHELRTPLNAIRGFCGIMLDGMGGEIDHDARHMLTRIQENGTRLLTLINDILDLSRIEAGRMDAQSIPFEPQKLAQDWQAQMSALAIEKGLEFQVTVDENMPDVLISDPERITQVIVNLLSNAFKFTHSGGVYVDVRPIENNTQFQITVRDTGIGIPPHAQTYIFDEFRQLDSSSTRQYGGSGLGLSIVRNITRILEGTISVFSDDSIGGSTFTLTLPMKQSQKIADEL